jgi:glycosyltransferase involved in cell wall biosynthesis
VNARVLFLSPSFPLPSNNGHKMRTWALLRAFAAEGCEVSLLAVAEPQELAGHEATVRAVCRNIEPVAHAWMSLARGADMAGRLRRLWSSRPYTIARFESAAMREAVARRLGRGDVDAVVSDVFMLVNVPPTAVPIIVNNENIEHVIIRRYVPHEPNLGKRLYAALEWRKTARWEAAAFRRAAVAMACSEPDATLVRAMCPGLATALVPNVVDTELYTPRGDVQEARVLFQGGMDWLPNQDAARYFIGAILPRLRRAVPGVRFVVAGRNPSPALVEAYRHLADVQFTGTVPDMRAEIAQASVCVVPIRMGSGTRLKILEAAAMGKAIVSTRVGAEGLRFVDGQEMVIADDPEAFAAATARLLCDPWARKTLGDGARQRVESDYAFENLRRGVREALVVTIPREASV